jgi:hypothetical protein
VKRQEVVSRRAESGNGRGAADAAVRAMPVVVMLPPSVLSQKFIELMRFALLCRVPCPHDEAAMRGRPKVELVFSESAS